MQPSADWLRARVEDHLRESGDLKGQMAGSCMESILAAARLVTGAFRSGGKVLLCGNGGSAADCQHMAAEFMNRLTKDFPRTGLPAVALTTDTSFLTAFANDSGYEGVFERQIQTLGRPGDVLIGISTSGNSTNVIRAVEAARSAGMQTIVLTGVDGRLSEAAEVAISVPSGNTQNIQEAHLAIEHILCDLVECIYFGRHRPWDSGNLYEELFRKALRIRMVEERIADLYPSDSIQSPIHLSIGQEAVAVGACHSLMATDLLFCSYRSHAFYLAKGGDLRQMIAELFGKATGCGEGKGGSMHLSSPEVGLMGSSAIVASTIPHAVGAALAAKREGRDQVTVAVFGDGAADEGVYHESLNFAALHKLPVLFLLENNGYAVHSRAAARHSFNACDHARSYGLPVTHLADGHDLMQVHDAISEILGDVRQRCSPHFIEIKTYRYRQHVGPSEDYEAGYRSREELARWQARDPLIVDQELVAKYQAEIAREIDQAVNFAEASPWPGMQHLLADII